MEQLEGPPSLCHTHTLPVQPHIHPRREARHTPEVQGVSWGNWTPGPGPAQCGLCRGGLRGASLCPRMSGEHWSPKEPTVRATVPHLFFPRPSGMALEEKHATEGKTRTPERPALPGQMSPASVRPAGTASPWAGPLQAFHTGRPANGF